MSSQPSGHWVEELFAPTFTLSADQLDAEKPSSAPEDLSVFEQVAKHKISELDVDALKNVYERVWLMMKIQKEQQEEEPRDEGAKRFGDLSEPASADRESQKKTKPTPQKSDRAVSPMMDLNLNESCIWNSEEIGVLRAVFKSTKADNSRLKAVLDATNQHVKSLELRCKEQEKTMESRNKNLHDAKKANQRLHILSRNLKSELDKTTAKLDYCRTELQETLESRSELAKKAHALQIDMDKERIERQQVEMMLQNQQRDAFRALEIREGHMKVKHDSEVTTLKRQMEELEKELAKEKKDHERTKRGLDHLRTHFASLPLGGLTGDEEPVNQDQLTSWTY